MGGLGNQLFQIAAAKSLSLSMGDDLRVNHDNCFTPNQGHRSEKYRASFFKNILTTTDIPSAIYAERRFPFDPIPKINNLTIKGYFQSEKYFQEHKEEITNLFYPTSEEMEETAQWKKSRNISGETVSVHIRRGDYIKFSHFHSVSPIEYFIKAMESFDNVTYVIFSDDVQWVKENIKHPKAHFSDGGDEVEDLRLMLSCDHNIISNSSFSWWAAYLNKNPNKRVIYPKEWFTPAANIDTKDLCPEKWERL